MLPHQILQASLADILFEHRNKAYGAYPLRVYYSQRLTLALFSVLSVTALVFGGSQWLGEPQVKPMAIAVGDINLDPLGSREEPPPPPPPPPPMDLQAPVAMTAHFPPLIVPDELVLETEVPDASVLETSRIGPINMAGGVDMGIVAPEAPLQAGTGEAVAPVNMVREDTIFYKVELPAEFPGGADAWRRYLERNLHIPEQAIERGTQGTVSVQFIIDQEGKISQVEALNDPGNGLAEEAVRIIQRGPRWIPAQQNNRKVKYRHIQRITFAVM